MKNQYFFFKESFMKSNTFRIASIVESRLSPAMGQTIEWPIFREKNIKMSKVHTDHIFFVNGEKGFSFNSKKNIE